MVVRIDYDMAHTKQPQTVRSGVWASYVDTNHPEQVNSDNQTGTRAGIRPPVPDRALECSNPGPPAPDQCSPFVHAAPRVPPTRPHACLPVRPAARSPVHSLTHLGLLARPLAFRK